VAHPARGLAWSLSPYDIAYLRGGAFELLKLRLFHLVHGGYLVVQEKHEGSGIERRLVANPAGADPPLRMDRELIEKFSAPCTAAEINMLDFPDDLAAICEKSRQRLIYQGLLAGWFGPDSKPAFLVILSIGTAVFAIATVFLAVVLGRFFVGLFITAFVTGFLLLAGTALLSYQRTLSGKHMLKEIESNVSAALAGLVRMDADLDEKQILAVAAHGFRALGTSELDALAALFGDLNPKPYYGTRRAGNQSNGCSGCGGCGCGG